MLNFLHALRFPRAVSIRFGYDTIKTLTLLCSLNNCSVRLSSLSDVKASLRPEFIWPPKSICRVALAHNRH